MREIALFVEDDAHRQVIGALVERLAQDAGVDVRLDWRNARHGHSKVVQELKQYVRDLERQVRPAPDLLIVATDANCKGLNERANELIALATPVTTIFAIPDPHIERWLLLDGAAFKAVFGKGCDAPDQKCCRDRYKERLIEQIFAAGIRPSLGGIEFAQDLVSQMDLDRAANADKSLDRFITDVRRILRGWRS